MKRRPSEKLFPKRYASCFKGTALEQMLSTLGVDTVIVVGAIAPSPLTPESASPCPLAKAAEGDVLEHGHRKDTVALAM